MRILLSFKLCIASTLFLLCMQVVRAENADCDRIASIIEESYQIQIAKPDSARILALEAVNLSMKCKNDSLLASSRVRLGSVFIDLGEYEQALNAAMLAYKYSLSSLTPRIQVAAAQLLESIYSATNNEDLAKKYALEALQIAERNKLYEEWVRSLINTGVEVFEKDPKQGIAALKKADSIATVHSPQADINNVRYNLATISAINGDVLLAKRLFEGLLADEDFSADLTSLFYATINLGFNYTDLSKPDSAYFCFRKALNYVTETNKFEELVNANFALYIHFKNQEQFDSALFYFESVSAYQDSAMNTEKQTAITELREKFEADLREGQIGQLEKDNKIASLQRNLFIAIAIVLLLLGITIAFVLTNRLRLNRLLSEQKIAQLEKEKEVLSLQSMLVAQEEERQRIARDLHDSIGALLSAAKLHITNIAEEVKRLEEVNFLKSTEEAIDRANAEIRRVAHDMMPGVLMKLGLTEGIEDFIDRLRKSSSIKVDFVYDEVPNRLDSKREVMLYRIVQELVNNTLKHASAKRIQLELRLKADSLTLDYKDDGKGFDAIAQNKQASFGLTSLRSRVNFLNGSIQLDSKNNEGMHCHIEIPLI